MRRPLTRARRARGGSTGGAARNKPRAGAGRQGSPEGAPPPTSAQESGRTDRADRSGPPRAGLRVGAPPPGARVGEGAPRPHPPRGSADARAAISPPAAVRTRAKGIPPAADADGRAAAALSRLAVAVPWPYASGVSDGRSLRPMTSAV